MIKWWILRVLFPKYHNKLIDKIMGYNEEESWDNVILQGSMGEDNDRREEWEKRI